jgi:transcription antitermination factor NusG
MEQMQQFIAICDTFDESLTYLSPDEINLEKGTPVKIIGGAFDGVVGTFIKVHNSRKKRVVVLVQGVTAVMLAEFNDGYLQPL